MLEKIPLAPLCICIGQIQAQVVLRLAAFGREQREHAIDRVQIAIDVVPAVVRPMCRFPRVGVTDSLWRAGKPGEQARSKQALQIDGQIIARPAKPA